MLLVCYPSHLFAGKRNITLDYGPPGGPGLLVLYNHLVADPQIEWLQEMKQQGYIKS